VSNKLLAEWFWTDRWEGSSASLLPIEPRGLYREMLTQAWKRGACLPNDHEAIQRAVRCTPDEWARCWPKVKRFWRVEGDTLVNDTQLDVYAGAQSLRQKRQVAGKRGGQSKANDRAKHVATGYSPSPSPSPSPSLNQSPENERTDADGRPANPFLARGERPAKEQELLRLVRREAELTNRDGAEVMAEVTSYHGAKTSKLNPASMSDDRLLNSLLDARARVKRLEQGGIAHGRP
jgi:uncharacterized protein YdaU (DUF1376 family)